MCFCLHLAGFVVNANGKCACKELKKNGDIQRWHSKKNDVIERTHRRRDGNIVFNEILIFLKY